MIIIINVMHGRIFSVSFLSVDFLEYIKMHACMLKKVISKRKKEKHLLPLCDNENVCTIVKKHVWKLEKF